MICKHKNWVPAGYPENQKEYVRVQSIYHVFCKDCSKFINLLTKLEINDPDLIALKEAL